MSASTTARRRARDELKAEILDAARYQVAEVGAAALSMRAVARELGMVSSAVYRYFPSRDDLLTALIIQSYRALADALRAADSPRAHPRRRWSAVCRALREWALAHPHEYALLYGTPVPGYRAPRDTVDPAADVLSAFVDVVRAASSHAGPDDTPPPGRELGRQLERIRAEYAPEVPTAVLARVFQAFGQLFGAISLELFGHFVGSMDPAGPLYEMTVHELADRLGLTPGNRRDRAPT